MNLKLTFTGISNPQKTNIVIASIYKHPNNHNELNKFYLSDLYERDFNFNMIKGNQKKNFLILCPLSYFCSVYFSQREGEVTPKLG